MEEIKLDTYSAIIT